MEFKIYILKSTDEEVKYVGITTGKLSQRLSKHYYDVKVNKTKNLHKIYWFNNNLHKINIEQIDVASNKQEAFEKEVYWIDKFKKEGINLINKTNGGEGCYGYTHNEETIAKISGVNNHMFGKKHTQQWIDNAKSRTPHNKGKVGMQIAWNKGVKCNDEVRSRLDRTGKLDSDEVKLKKSQNSKSHLRKKAVECFINNVWIEYTSAIDAANDLNLNRAKIVLVCNNKRNHTGGYKFRYKIVNNI